MKKIFLIFSIVFLLLSCKVKSLQGINEETIIANRALKIAKSDYTEINLLAKPSNDIVIRFKDGGFDDDEYNIYMNKFYFKNIKIKSWNKDIALGNDILRDRITIIEDYSKIEKIPWYELEKSKTILSISNVMFSDDGKLAIVNISTFSNSIDGDYWGQMYVFKKEGNEWVYFFDFMTVVS